MMWKESWKKIASVTPLLLTIGDMLVSSCEVSGTSMQPTFNPSTSLINDRVLVDKLSIKLHQYRCGDVVVVRAPDEPRMLLVKRLRALEGDWVKTQGSLGMTQVPKGHCWLEGDNPSCSRDSISAYGPVPLALIDGRVTHIFWPPGRIRKIESKIQETPWHTIFWK
mmetsp:Transcript_11473/g.70532  ORF Transcript_11473/g.70532 Transcript_11473/m.70532 type:complete len:166 (-) Transcript_11473:1995-2492(-)